MSATDDELSEAVVIVVGFRTRNHPVIDYAAIAQRYGTSRAPGLASRVEAILTELGPVEVDWSRHSLASGGDEARRVMAARHPELNDEALAALSWKFTFDWR
jgi:hypothetical protein